MKARLITCGGAGYWEAELTEPVYDQESDTHHPVGYRVRGIYAEHVRANETPP